MLARQSGTCVSGGSTEVLPFSEHRGTEPKAMCKMNACERQKRKETYEADDVLARQSGTCVSGGSTEVTDKEVIMSITGIDSSSYYSDYYTQATNASAAALENTLSKVDKTATEKELMEACKEFEAYFIEQIYKGMEKTIIKAEDEEENSTASKYTDYFSDMRTEAYAKATAEQGEGLGLAQQLYEQMKRNYGL